MKSGRMWDVWLNISKIIDFLSHFLCFDQEKSGGRYKHSNDLMKWKIQRLSREYMYFVAFESSCDDTSIALFR